MGNERLYYYDNLRLFIITFVVIQHAASICSNLISLSPRVPIAQLDFVSAACFAVYLIFQQSYLMGLMFLIAGYFISGSYDRKKFLPFVKDRFIRLMIPTILTAAIINPLFTVIFLGGTWLDSSKDLLWNISTFQKGIGVMWFAETLFFFSLIYGLVRLIGGKKVRTYKIKLSFSSIAWLIAVITILNFVVRIVFPRDIFVLGFYPGDFPTYIAYFIVGTVARKNNFLEEIRYKTGITCTFIAIVFGNALWITMMLFSIDNIENVEKYYGGLHLQSALFALWQAVVAMLMIIGLIGIFREKFNTQTRFSKCLSDNSFAVYVFHIVILGVVAIFISPIDFHPIIRWFVMWLIGLPLCFASSHYIFSNIPLLNRIL